MPDRYADRHADRSTERKGGRVGERESGVGKSINVIIVVFIDVHCV